MKQTTLGRWTCLVLASLNFGAAMDAMLGGTPFIINLCVGVGMAIILPPQEKKP